MASNYEKIRGDNIREYGEGTRHLSFLGQLYTERTHFIFELLQNAEDAAATKILFELSDNMLEVKHDGRPFNEHDVKGICGVGAGTKTQDDLTQIGKFGIGFKSVYAYTSTPEIHSGDENFGIEYYVRPFSIDPKDIGDSWTTLFSFKFNAGTVEPEQAFREIATRLSNLSARTLLFLKQISEIEYKLPNDVSGVYLREANRYGTGERVTVIGQKNIEQEDEIWLVFRNPVSSSNRPQAQVEVAFMLDPNVEEQTKSLIRVESAPLFVYFPTEKQTPFGFLIQGPYRTTPSRDNIPKDDDWNLTLIEETGRLVVNALLNIKEMGLLTVSVLESMPIRIRMEDFPENDMFSPIVESVHNAFFEHELLPADDGTYVSANNAKLARGSELRDLLNQERLRSLLQSSDPTKWLMGTITQDRTPELRDYLMKKLNVEEIDPDRLVGLLTGKYLKLQSDEWVISMYEYFGDHRALWRIANGRRIGPLFDKKFIRLQDSSQVKPFREDGAPKAYISDGIHIETSLPIVKVEITQHEESFQFLKKLGIPEFDLVAEVIEEILPKYTNNCSRISIEEHQRDISVIENAYTTNSYESKERLSDKLEKTPFVCAEGSHDDGINFKKPCELYFVSDELRLYFSGNNGIEFINTQYSESVRSLLRDLGVAGSVRIQLTEPNYQGHVVIKQNYGEHERGLNGFDPEFGVDGLEFALTSPALENVEFIWNTIAVPYSQFIRGVIESSSKKTYEHSTKQDRISEFGHLLVNSAWLPKLDTNSMKKPRELKLDDLPESFIKDEKLAQQLGMKQDVIGKLAEKAGVATEDIELLKRYPTEFQKWKLDMSTNKQKPVFPERTSSNPKKRRKKLTGQLKNSVSKDYEIRDRSVRTTRVTVDPNQWLRSQYTNETEQLICQICKEEMPFRKRNNEFYFEAVELLSKDYLPIEHESQYLALCPVCTAMYKEFIKSDDTKMVNLVKEIKDKKKIEECEIALCLGGLNTSIQFVETHFIDIRTILKESE